MTKADKKIDNQAEKKEWDLKARLAFNGLTQRDVAEKLGTHFTLVNKVIRGHRKTKRVLRFIQQLPLAGSRGA